MIIPRFLIFDVVLLLFVAKIPYFFEEKDLEIIVAAHEK